MGDGFLRNTVKLVSGNITAQAIAFGLMPVITRMYSPEEFGLFSLFCSLILVFGPVSNLRFSSAILLTEDGDAVNLLLLSSLCSLVFAALLSPLLFFVSSAEFKTALFDLGISPALVVPLTIGIALLGIQQNLLHYALRRRHFTGLAYARVFDSIGDKVFTISYGTFLHASFAGLIIGRVTGLFASSVILFLVSIRSTLRQACAVISFRQIRDLIIRYKDFPKFSALAVLLNAVSREMPTVLLACIFSPAVAGAYSLGVRVVRMPMLLVAESVSKVYFETAASRRDEAEKLAGVTFKMISILIYAFLPVTLFLIIMGDKLTSVVFGGSWLEAGVYLQILAPTFFLLVLYTAISTLFDSFEKQKHRLFFDVLILLGRLLGIAVGFALGSPLYSIGLMTAFTILILFFALSILLGFVNISSSAFFIHLLKRLLLLLPMIIGTISARIVFDRNLFYFWLLITFTILIQFILLFICDRDIRATFNRIALVRR
jgi:O-antigen/teichoic acid export membrane protein